MSEREELINLIRNEYDPKPNLGRGDYPAFDSEWDDGAGRIVDAVLADKTLALRQAAARIEALEAALLEAFMAMCAYRDNKDEEVFQDAIDALGLAALAEEQDK